MLFVNFYNNEYKNIIPITSRPMLTSKEGLDLGVLLVFILVVDLLEDRGTLGGLVVVRLVLLGLVDLVFLDLPCLVEVLCNLGVLVVALCSVAYPVVLLSLVVLVFGLVVVLLVLLLLVLAFRPYFNSSSPLSLSSMQLLALRLPRCWQKYYIKHTRLINLIK